MVVHWKERDLIVVFPIAWAKKHGDLACIERAKARIQEFEDKLGGRNLAPGSTIKAFSEHGEAQQREQIERLNPEVRKGLL